MKVLLVNGGPHEKGCTYTALKEVANTLEKEGIETEIFWVKNKPIGGCIACNSCVKNGKCIFEDSVNEFVLKAEEADGFIFGTPVHYAAGHFILQVLQERQIDFYINLLQLSFLQEELEQQQHMIN